MKKCHLMLHKMKKMVCIRSLSPSAANMHMCFKFILIFILSGMVKCAYVKHAAEEFQNKSCPELTSFPLLLFSFGCNIAYRVITCSTESKSSLFLSDTIVDTFFYF